MKVTQVNNNGAGGGGAVVVVLAAAVLAAVAGLSWMGKHAAEIDAGVRALVEVAVTMVITAGVVICCIIWHQRRQAAITAAAAEQEREQPHPIRAVSEQVPVQLPADEEPVALPPRGTHLHFHGLTPEQLAVLVTRSSDAYLEENK